MLTVTWQVKPFIVTAHLVFGLTTLGLLWWLWLSLPAGPRRTTPKNTVAPAIPGAAVTPGPVVVAATPGTRA